MRRMIVVVCSCLSFASIGGLPRLAAQDPPQQPQMYRLSDRLRAGDAVLVTENADMTVAVQGRVDIVETKMMRAIDRYQSAYRLDVVSVDAKGLPTHARLKTSRERRTVQQPGGKLITRRSSAEGRTLTLKKSGNRTIATLDRGRLTAAEKAELKDALNTAYESPFPDYELALGEEWTMDSTSWAKEFGGDGTATLAGKLLDVVQKAGHPCARAKVDMEFSGRRNDWDFEMTMKLSGEIYYALDLKRILVVNVSGPVSITGEVYVQGIPVAFSGDGTAKINDSYRWLKVAGKPVK